VCPDKIKNNKSQDNEIQEQRKPANVSVLADITKHCHPEQSEGPAVSAAITRLPFKLRL
jgi:hypothetical protein